jgi:hypothetical protein
MRPLLLEATSRVRVIGHLVACIEVQIAVEVQILRIRRHLPIAHALNVAVFGYLACDAENNIRALLEMLISKYVSESEIALQREEAVTASLMIGSNPSTLYKQLSTPIFSEIVLSPPCLNSSSSFTICLIS